MPTSCNVGTRRRTGLIAALFGALVVMAGSAAGQSALGTHFRIGYGLSQLRADLRCSEVTVEPEVVITAYRAYLDEWATLRADARTELDRIIGNPNQVLRGAAETERAIALLRRTRTRELGAETRMLETIAASVADGADRVARIREWRRMYHAHTDFNPVTHQVMDLGGFLRHTAVSSAMNDDERRATMAALALSEVARRSALEQMQAALEDGELAAARIVDAAGMAGLSENESRGNSAHSSARMDRYQAFIPSPQLTADLYETQLRAFRAVEPKLSPANRRALLDNNLERLLEARVGGPRDGLPKFDMECYRPSQLAAVVLASRDLSAEKRDATRKTLAAWLKEADDLLLTSIEEGIAKLRGWTEYPRAIPTERDERWPALARKHLALVADASGATWLLDESAARPKLEDGSFSAEDAVVTGTTDRYIARYVAYQESKRPPEFLPRPFVDADRQRFVALGDSEETRTALSDLFDLHDLAWTSAVAPQLAACRDADQAASASPTPSAGEARTRVAAIDAARRAAYDAARTVDRDFFDQLASTIGDGGNATALRLRARRELEDILPRLRTTQGTGASLERRGGFVFNCAEALDDPGVSREARRIAEEDGTEAWTRLVDLAIATRETQFAQAQAKRLRELGAVNDAPAQRTAGARALEAAEGLAVAEPVRAATAEVMKSTLEAVAAKGLDDAALRIAFERRRYPMCYNECVGHFKIDDALRGLPDFDGKPPLQAEVARHGEVLLRMARRRVEMCLPFQTADAPMTQESLDRAYVRGGIDRDISLAGGSLLSGELWLISQRVWADAVASSPELARMIQSYR